MQMGINFFSLCGFWTRDAVVPAARLHSKRSGFSSNRERSLEPHRAYSEH
jgi:hypothetical protein